jgi:enoyl-CoA hydratase/carnithine racemase
MCCDHGPRLSEAVAAMNYDKNNNIVTLTFDDGKANVVGPEFLTNINACLDRAEAEKAGAVILCGREGMFSGGFDLAEFQKGPEAGLAMVQRGFELLIRLYSFPLPLVAACTGHGVAMGAFIIMACDTRIGCQGKFKMSLPETAIGMQLPPLLVELATSRISIRHITRVVLQSEAYAPTAAVDAGFIDEVVEEDQLMARAMKAAEQLSQLPQAQYAENKLSVRARHLQVMKDSLAQMTS